MNFKDTLIAIPSRGRATSKQMVTLRNLPPAWLKSIVVVVPAAEQTAYRRVVGEALVVSPTTTAEGIAATRHWIIQQAPKCIMLDDDMSFCVRESLDSPKLATLTPDGMVELLERMDTLLADYPMVGVSARQGNNHVLGHEYVENTRAMNFYGFRRDVLLRDVEFGRVPVMEDFDITLQLLRKGHKNAVLYKWAWNQVGSGAEGGCSLYRTAEVQAAAAHELARLHPGLVRVVVKENKTGWDGMKTRTDVVIGWKAAAEGGAFLKGKKIVQVEFPEQLGLL